MDIENQLWCRRAIDIHIQIHTHRSRMRLEKMDIDLTLDDLRQGFMDSNRKRKPQNRTERRLLAQATARMSRKGNA